MDRPRAITLRPACLGDARPMAEMSRDLIETGLPWRYTPARMATLIRDPDSVALVASDGTRLQGLAVMHFGDVQAHLTLLCVRPALRRRGIGQRLHQWLIESAQVAGIESIRLELRADNAGALAFYQAIGYSELPPIPGYYDGRVAARRMTLVLRATAP